MSKKVYIFPAYERFWHWTQALLIFFLALTGFEIHGSISFFGFNDAVKYHNIAANSLIVLTLFTVFWHFTTGEWRQYIPTMQNIKNYFNFYLFGIFKNAPHPTKKTVLSKLNPLQKLTYFGLKTVIFPGIILTGLLYMFYRYPQRHGIESINIDSLETIAVLHTLGAYLILAFVIGHLYLITTGSKITTNLEAMITGYEELEDDEESKKTEDKNGKE